MISRRTKITSLTWGLTRPRKGLTRSRKEEHIDEKEREWKLCSGGGKLEK